jgi:hypothetical protein
MFYMFRLSFRFISQLKINLLCKMQTEYATNYFSFWKLLRLTKQLILICFALL